MLQIVVAVMAIYPGYAGGPWVALLAGRMVESCTAVLSAETESDTAAGVMAAAREVWTV